MISACQSSSVSGGVTGRICISLVCIPLCYRPDQCRLFCMNTTPSPDYNDPSTLTLARRIYYRRFSSRVAALGLDVDDAFGDILEGLVRKSRSNGSRWDPNRGGLSTWTYVAISGLVLNMAAKARVRIALDYTDDDTYADVAESDSSWGLLELSDLAAEMDLPPSVVAGLAAGLGGFDAGLAGGLDFVEASELGARFAA